MNNSFEEIGNKLLTGNRIYLFPHENPDGDAIGSTAALCRMLRGMGKDCRVMVDEELPDNLEGGKSDEEVDELERLRRENLRLKAKLQESERLNLLLKKVKEFEGS